MPDAKPVLLIFSQWFLPAKKAGGPIRSIANLVNLLGGVFEIVILAGDRDLGDSAPLCGIKINEWIQRPDYRIIYLSPENVNRTFIKNTILEVKPDVVYLNSMYAYRFSLLPLMILNKMQFKGRVVLAPRGMLKVSAIAFKPWKKKLFLFFAKHSSLLRKVNFHATDTLEATDIKKKLNIRDENIHLVGNPPHWIGADDTLTKIPGEVSIIFIGRIHPIKGLHILLHALQDIQHKVTLKVVGWIEKEKYHQVCLDIIKTLPSNCKVTFTGDLAFEEMIGELQSSHALVLPTTGENFGHAIFESLSAGKPAVISDQTPWKDLPQHMAGWVVPVNDIKAFREAILELILMDQNTYQQYSNRAEAYARRIVTDSDYKRKYTRLFSGHVSPALVTK